MDTMRRRRPRGRRVTVIVGASSGIGRAAAHAFAGHGDDLVLAARSAESLRACAEECRGGGGRVVVVPTDVRSDAQVQALVDRALAEFGRIDVWVGAASVFSYGSVEQTPPEVFDAVLDTNLGGQIRSVRAVLPVFRQQGRGSLVMVSSLYSHVPSAYTAPYVSSKFALRGFAGVLRQELVRFPGIDVSLVAPATIDTPIYQHAANFTGRRPHPLPPVVAPSRVARAIVRVARRPRPEVWVGTTQQAVRPFFALAPRGYARATRRVMDVFALRGRPRDEASVARSTGTVFDAAPAGNAVRGGWRSAPLRILTALAAVAALAALVRRDAPARRRG